MRRRDISRTERLADLLGPLLDKLGLRSYPKTSGATGMQIMVPLDGTTNYDMVRGFVGTISDMIHEADKETTTLEWEVRKRTGKVFLDVNMNREGANIAAAYTARPEPGATVSAPFDWLAQGMGHAAGWMFEAVWKVFDSTTMVDVTSSQYTKVYNILFGVAVFAFHFLEARTDVVPAVRETGSALRPFAVACLALWMTARWNRPAEARGPLRTEPAPSWKATRTPGTACGATSSSRGVCGRGSRAGGSRRPRSSPSCA